MATLKPTEPDNSPPSVDGLLKILGQRIKAVMENKELSDEQVAYLVNLTPVTVRKIVAGTGSTLATFVLVCVALEVTPMEVFDFPIDLKPVNKLSNMPVRENSRPIYRKKILELIHKGWFSELKTTRQVCDYFIKKYKYNAQTKNLSSILKNFVKDGLLYVKKIDRINFYYTKQEL